MTVTVKPLLNIPIASGYRGRRVSKWRTNPLQQPGDSCRNQSTDCQKKHSSGELAYPDCHGTRWDKKLLGMIMATKTTCITSTLHETGSQNTAAPRSTQKVATQKGIRTTAGNINRSTGSLLSVYMHEDSVENNKNNHGEGDTTKKCRQLRCP